MRLDKRFFNLALTLGVLSAPRVTTASSTRTIYTGWLGPKYGITTLSGITWGQIGSFANMGLRRRWAQVPVANDTHYRLTVQFLVPQWVTFPMFVINIPGRYVCGSCLLYFILDKPLLIEVSIRPTSVFLNWWISITTSFVILWRTKSLRSAKYGSSTRIWGLWVSLNLWCVINERHNIM